MKNMVALIIASVSAYSFSFAIDLFLGGLLGIYPSTVFLPVVTWSIIATITGFVALRLVPMGRFLVIPFAGLALLAFLGGVVGHRHSLLVGGMMLAQAIGVWMATSTRQHSMFVKDMAFIEAQIKRWTQGVRRNPRDFESLVAIGAAYGKLGRDDTAIEYFKKAIAVNPKYAAAYLGMAASYGFLGRIDDKIAACKKAISLEPSNAEAYGNLGSALEKSGRHKESAEALEEAVRLKPAFADAHFLLGLVYISLGDGNLAIKQSQILDRLDPALAKQLKDMVETLGDRDKGGQSHFIDDN